MRAGLGIAAALALLTLLSYFQFPGHTYLQQDTQIYVPILEHLRDPSLLNQDILVQRPHVAFTLYDEVALGIRRSTGLGFHAILAGLQIVTRGLGLWGIYLIALALLEDAYHALLVSAVFALGAAIDGPAVLTIEYEPSPRAFAIPLVFFAIGLLAWRRPVWAGTTAAAGFLLHPPSMIPFWIIYLWRERNARAWAPFAIAVAILLAAASLQPGVTEAQSFFSRIAPDVERLQRMRAPYNWVSTWWAAQWWKYTFLAGVVAAGYWRVKKLGWFVVGLPALGLASVPLSYVLLERMKWELAPQVQPARTLLFVTAMAMVLAAAAGGLAAGKAQRVEAFGWFFAAVLPPLAWEHLWLAALLAASLTLAARYRWAGAPACLSCFFLIPMAGHVVNYPALHTRELEGLANWARHETAKDAVFAFPQAGKRLEPGIFRSEALRAVYVDWKGGGQVNYLPGLGEQWWTRWKEAMTTPLNLNRYREIGIGYVVLPPAVAMPGAVKLFQNKSYAVYSVPAKPP